jgi:hypothetical protein
VFKLDWPRISNSNSTLQTDDNYRLTVHMRDGMVVPAEKPAIINIRYNLHSFEAFCALSATKNWSCRFRIFTAKSQISRLVLQRTAKIFGFMLQDYRRPTELVAVVPTSRRLERRRRPNEIFQASSERFGKFGFYLHVPI